MMIKTAGRNCLKFAVLFLTAVLITGALFFTGVQPVSATNPAYNICTEDLSNPVFDPAEKAYYPSIVFDGSLYHLWYDNGSETMYSTSADGITWAAGVLVSGLNPGHSRHPHVAQVGPGYRIWYEDDTLLYTVNAIRTAQSVDGINWTSDQTITQVGTSVITGTWPDWNTGTYGVCEVFYNAGGSGTITVPVNAASVWANKFVMYYDGTTGAVEDIGMAVSADGILWEGYNGGAAPVLAHSGGTAWDSDFTTFCSVVNIGGVYQMWYSGGQVASNEGIGYAQSPDGLTWTKDAGNPMLHMTDGVTWRSGRTYTPEVIYNAGGSGTIQMWYNGTASGNYALGHALITALTPAPSSVGGEVGRVNKLALVAPYLGLGVIMMTAVFFGRKLIKVRNR